MTGIGVAIIGAGPYGLSLAAHLAGGRVKHRVFGRPMRFWSQIAAAGSGRYLKSFCFGTDLSTPRPGFTFADYSRPRGLETIEPCAIDDFSDYGRWFQEHNVPDTEPIDVIRVAAQADGFSIALVSGERFTAAQVVIATGLAHYAQLPVALRDLPPTTALHTSDVASFAAFAGRSVAVIGAGQSALEAAALLLEAGARPELLVRDSSIHWHSRIALQRSLWRTMRSPISTLGSGPKAWALSHFPGAVHRWPATWRARFVNAHLPAEGAWWLRDRVEHRVPIRFGTSVIGAQSTAGGARLELLERGGAASHFDCEYVIAGTGYATDVDKLDFIDVTLRRAIQCHGRAPALGATFESSVPGMRFIGPASAMSFGPLFRFVAGAEYSARIVSSALASAA